ncbi:MAG: tRNA pseudouridine(38-40) synthase TruA [Acidimicrobiales bacterium]|nr:tRNA pseudouridine(38-40) synthase TruA [Acidimicrobiales bacterium]
MRVRLDLAYRGTAFHGFAENPGVPTVEGTLRRELERVLRHGVSIDVAGRTDKGVHASGQVVSFSTEADHFAPDRLLSSLNKLCAPDIAVKRVSIVDPDFHARFSATGRRYVYRILDGTTPDPLRSDLVWHITDALDLEAMTAETAAVVGEHDFSAFCRPPKHDPQASLVRHVRLCAFSRTDDETCLEIEANAFCHQMVRSLVGALVAVGRHRAAPGLIGAMLTAPDRARAPSPAPPQGLNLVEVAY